MSNVGKLREAIVEILDAAIPDVTWYSGEIIGPSQDQDVGCVFWPGTSEFARDVLMEQPRLTIRAFLKQIATEQPVPEIPVADPAPLEDLAEQIQAALRARQADATIIGGYYRLTSLVPDHRLQMLEGSIIAFEQNVFAPL